MTKIPAAVFALLYASASFAAATPTNEALRRELLSMETVDQGVRQATPVDVKAVIAADVSHTSRMKEVIALHGWPSVALVGEDGAHAAWALVQHADADPAFQAKALKLMEPLLKAGELDRQNFAYLWDRVHSPQRFGTQGRCVSKTQWKPNRIKSERGVDARRKEMGMPPLAEYVSMASQHMCANWRAKP